MTFAPEYITYVLREHFEDGKKVFFSPLMAIHRAHLVMLAQCGIVVPADAGRLRDALNAIAEHDLHHAAYDPADEDLFFYIERLLLQECGEALAGRLHVARSRNDIDMTMYRMRQRELILDVIDATQALGQALLAIADQHRHTIFGAQTHTQPAQPTTVAHYLLAIVEQLERDATRLRNAYATTNRNPLGSCAITGTGFPIDRHLTSDLLGFAGPTGNTYGSIATVDYLLESTSAVGIMLAGLGRFVQDLLLWCMAEFDYVRLADGFVQTSSIMPQKRNPVALEHARAIASKALGQATGVLLSVHNTPFGDIVDTEDDLQPLVFSTFHDATRATKLVAAAMNTAEFDAARLLARAGEGWTTLTELADTLVRDHLMSFRTAHAIAVGMMAVRRELQGVSLAEALTRSAEQVAREHGLDVRLAYTDAELEEILSPQHFVEVRCTLGGPAPAETLRALEQARSAWQTDQQWCTHTREALTAAARRLVERSARL